MRKFKSLTRIRNKDRESWALKGWRGFGQGTKEGRAGLGAEGWAQFDLTK